MAFPPPAAHAFLRNGLVVLAHKWNSSKLNHPRCVCLSDRCRCRSITQQYLKKCLIKDDSNYMFRPTAAIIRFSSESTVVVLYRICMVMSRWWDLNICDVCYMLLLWEQRGWGYLWCALSWDVQLKYVCSLLSYVGLQLLLCPFPMSTAGGLLLWVVRALYPLYLWGSMCPVSLVVCVYLFSI